MTDIGQMDLDDNESVLRLLAEIKDLIRAEHLLSPEDRLSAIDHALVLALGATPEEARDFVRDVLLERLGP